MKAGWDFNLFALFGIDVWYCLYLMIGSMIYEIHAMPTIQDIQGPYRFFFYSFDCNEPKHVHMRGERKTCKLVVY